MFESLLRLFAPHKDFTPPNIPLSTPHSQRILVIDDLPPYPSLGAGYPRAQQLVKALVDLGHNVTVYTTQKTPKHRYTSLANDAAKVELILNQGKIQLLNFLKQRSMHYATIIVSRPTNMQLFKQIFSQAGINRKNTRIVYDAEALFSSREISRLSLQGKPLSENAIAKMIQQELSLAKDCDAVLSVSQKEKEFFMQEGINPVYFVGHAIAPSPTPTMFSQRQGILFIGPLYSKQSPNTDSIHWFLKTTFPLVLSQRQDIKFTLAGIHRKNILDDCDQTSLNILGEVKDVTSLYDEARVFIAPTRFAAGVPIKVYEAAAHGLPIVCTSLLAKQLGWENDIDLLVADTPELFAKQCIRLYEDEILWNRLREHALMRVQTDCSNEKFYQTLAAAISTEKIVS